MAGSIAALVGLVAWSKASEEIAPASPTEDECTAGVEGAREAADSLVPAACDTTAASR